MGAPVREKEKGGRLGWSNLEVVVGDLGAQIRHEHLHPCGREEDGRGQRLRNSSAVQLGGGHTSREFFWCLDFTVSIIVHVKTATATTATTALSPSGKTCPKFKYASFQAFH